MLFIDQTPDLNPDLESASLIGKANKELVEVARRSEPSVFA